MPLPNYPESTEFEGTWPAIKEFLNYLVSPELQEKLFTIKILLIVVCGIFVVLIVYFIFHSTYFEDLFVRDLKNFLFPKTMRDRVVARKWRKIKHGLDRGKLDSQWKVALLEAFEFMEKTMEKMGFTGETLADRLGKVGKEEVPNINDSVEAAQLCQSVIKDPDFKIKKSKIEEAVRAFEKTLNSLEIL